MSVVLMFLVTAALPEAQRAEPFQRGVPRNFLKATLNPVSRIKQKSRSPHISIRYE